MRSAVKKWWGWSQEIVSMILVQFFVTGMQMLSKVILNQGIFIFALMTYRHVIAAVCVAPFAFIFERGKPKKLSLSVCFWLFINASTGITAAMGLYYYGLEDTTATYAINFLNLLPVVTFVFSTILRIEKLGLNTKEGKVKTLGTILCVGGALITCLYKGKAFHIFPHKINSHIADKVSKTHWIRGSLMLVGSCFSYASWYIVQVKLLKLFPFKYTVTMITCIIAFLQSMVIGLCLDRHKASWRLGWNLQLLTIIYSGAVATAAVFCLVTRAIAKKGPTYPPMFNPLSLIFVAILEALILGQDLTLGILLGSVIIVAGLYFFLWAKTKEFKRMMAQRNSQGEQPVSTIISDDHECAKPQSKSTVIPTTSPVDSVVNIEVVTTRDPVKP